MTQQTLTITSPAQVPVRRRRFFTGTGKGAEEHPNRPGTVVLILCSIAVFLPLYATLSMAFKTSEQAADGNALTLVTAPLAVALHATRLSEELQSSREQIVAAREEERRRLRRDLHDGLGPTLTGMALAADAA